MTACAKAGDVKSAQRVYAAYEVLRHDGRRVTYLRTGLIPEARRLPPDERYVAPRSVAWREWSPAGAPHRPVHRTRGELLRRAAVLVAALAVVGALWQSGVLRHGGAGAASDVWQGTSASSVGPATPLVTRRHRLLPAQEVAGAGGYVAVNGARYNPCQPIRYVVSGVPPFAGAAALLRKAITATSRATGLQFVYAGTTPESPTEQRAPYQPDRYGDRWATVLVAWTDDATVPALAGNVVGLGGSAPMSVDGHRRLVSGLVYLDSPDLGVMAQRPDGPAQAQAVIEHELGHRVGLDHVADAASIMYPETSPTTLQYSPGDLRGLAWAGGDAC